MAAADTLTLYSFFLQWHPVRPIIASVSSFGNIYIWTAKHEENWSAFAPDFIELEENLEYEEKEDEFDIVPDDEKTKRKQVDEDISVDVTTCDSIQAFIDSDAEEDTDEVFHLTSLPFEDEEDDHLHHSGDEEYAKKSTILLKRNRKKSNDTNNRPRKQLKM